MLLYKLMLPRCDLATADAISDLLQNAAAPEPVAVSLFEVAGETLRPAAPSVRSIATNNEEQWGDVVPATGPAAGAAEESPDFDPSRTDWSVEAYFDTEPDFAALKNKLGAVTSPTLLDQLSLAPIPSENWVALSQAALPPVSAGRFIIHGSHDRRRVGRRPFAIEIDAGEAFGTAHHATTLGCLLALDRLTRQRRSFNTILDLGCGSAILAIAAAKALPRARITASDIDPQAVVVAQRNTKANGAAARIELFAAAGLTTGALATSRRFDLIFANILAAPLIELAAGLGRAIKPAGIAIISGLLNSQAREVIANYNAAGFNVLKHDRLGEWSTLVLQKRI